MNHPPLTQDEALAGVLDRVDGLAPWLRERDHAANCYEARWRITGSASLCFPKASKLRRGWHLWAQCSGCGIEVTIEC